MHPAFGDRLIRLEKEVVSIKSKMPKDAADHPKLKLFARILALIKHEIPANPNAPEYLQGNTLGQDHRHWRRAKFLGRFRLFFRFSSIHKIIIYGWVNDENTLRKAGANSDPYAVFARRLREGKPPDDWDSLLKESTLAEPRKSPARKK